MLMIRSTTAPAMLLLLVLNTSSAAALDDDAKPVEFFMQNVDGQGVHLAVPKVFLVEFQRNGRLDNLLFLDVVFPEMTPTQPMRRTAQQIFEDISKALDENKTLDQVDPEYKHREGTWIGGVRLSGTTLERHARALDNRISRYEPYEDENEPGFHHYRRDAGSITEELLVPEEQDFAHPIWFECSPPVSCRAWTIFGDRIRLTYVIDRTSISQWSDLDAKVRAWLRTFVLDCFEGRQLEFGEKPTASYPCPF